MEDLVKKILVGEKGSVMKLYRELSPILKRYLRRRLGKEEDVEELLQDSFLSLLDALPVYKNKSSVKTYALAIARHEVADWYRKRYVRKAIERTTPLFDDLMGKLSSPEWEMEKTRLKQKFYRTYRQMSKRQQDALSYRYELGMSVKEVAKKMKLSVKATESLLYRTRVAFRVAYEK